MFWRRTCMFPLSWPSRNCNRGLWEAVPGCLVVATTFCVQCNWQILREIWAWQVRFVFATCKVANTKKKTDRPQPVQSSLSLPLCVGRVDSAVYLLTIVKSWETNFAHSNCQSDKCCIAIHRVPIKVDVRNEFAENSLSCSALICKFKQLSGDD